MGKAVWGTSGGFQGKNGGNIGRWRKGDNIVGPLPHPTTIPPTVPLLNSRAKFGLMMRFLGWVSPIIKVGFENERVGNQTAFNVAFSYNYKNAVTGVAPAYTIDYPKLMFSQGRLGYPYDLVMATTEDAQLDFSWTNVVTNGLGGPTDLATFVVYNPAKQLFVSLVGAVARSVLSYDLSLPANFSGDSVYVYMFFVSDNGLVSNSMYAGTTVVQ
jgi:hypothetical protein